MFKCEEHVRGHKTEQALQACLQRVARRAARIKRMEEDKASRLALRRAEPELEYIRRSFCREQNPSERVAKYLRDKYPPREDGREWDWAAVVQVHAEQHLKWPTTESLLKWLGEHPDVMLPSELRKKAGVSMESGKNE